MTPTATRMTADERRDAIVMAAMTEFATTGFYGTSTEAIARRSGVSQPYLFQLFGTKKDLFLAAIRHGFGRTRLVFETVGARAQAEDPTRTTSCTRWARRTASSCATASCCAVRLQAYAACDDPDIRAVVGEEFMRVYRTVAELSGADDIALEDWFAKGMLMNTAAAIGPQMAKSGVFRLRRAREDRRRH